MDLSDFKSLRRWSDLPRKFSHLSRMAYMVFLAVTGLFLVTLSWVMLQQPTVASTSSSSPSIDYANGKAPAAAPAVIHTPVPTPELSSVTIHHSDEGTSHVDHSATPLIKPDGMRIVGVIFYGRRDRASLLECYLRKNLVSYGGWLDEVIWAANTDDADDLAYGEHIAATQNEYTYLSISSTDDQGEGYMNIYRNAFKEPDTIYVKMDDDVLFIDQSAIPRVVMTLLNNPRALLVSANVVNNPALGWVHYHMGAVHPYVPEVRPDGDNLASKENGAWRSSELPTWSGAEWEMPELDHFYSLFGVNDKTNVPLHRWIPTRNLSLLHKTPVAKSEYNAFGNNLHFWPLAAQAHYSLLQNIEEKRLGRYFMVHGSDEEAVSTWDMNGSRISINFMVIKGKDIIDNISNLQPDDENKLTVELPTLLNRAVLVETTSVVSHFSFGPQKNLAKTDILARYHNYANQNICPSAILEPEVLLATDKMPGAAA